MQLIKYIDVIKNIGREKELRQPKLYGDFIKKVKQKKSN